MPLDADEEQEVVNSFIRHSIPGNSARVTLDETIADTRVSKNELLRVLRKFRAIDQGKAIRHEIQKEVYKDKIPLVKNIVGLSLRTINDYLQDLEQDPISKAGLTIQDLKGLADIATQLNGLLRLEEGKSNLNISMGVEHSYKTTLQALDKLRKIDPVFEYRGLPDSLLPEEADNAIK
jgi:hypothetical protein